MSKKQARNTQPAKPAGMKKLEHRGYTIVQSPRNHHVMIGKDGHSVYHAQVDHPLTDEELRRVVDDYISLAGIADSIAASVQKVANTGPAPKSRKKAASKTGAKS